MSEAAAVLPADGGELVMAATAWPNNGAMIADLARLGYLRRSDRVIDPTWGRGVWWRSWQPDELVRHDLYKLDGVDFRHLPWGDGTFTAAAWDPPYVTPGGRSTSSIPDFHDRYGMGRSAATPAAQQAINDEGLAEVVRVLRPRSVIVAKAMDYVWSGRLVMGTHATLSAALALGCEVVDRLEHISRPRAQPRRSRADGKPVVQQHARRNYSTVLVLRTPARHSAGRGGRPSLFDLIAMEGATT